MLEISYILVVGPGFFCNVVTWPHLKTSENFRSENERLAIAEISSAKTSLQLLRLVVGIKSSGEFSAEYCELLRGSLHL